MKILVVGLGSIGQRHARNVRLLGLGPVTVCDPSPAALAAVTKELGVDGFAELAPALARRPDAVIVCTPTDRHLEIARAALEADAHALVEKPVAATLDGVATLATLARARQRVALVACNMRFHPGVAALREAVREGLAGRPLHWRSRFSHYLPNWRPGTDYRLTYSARRGTGGGIIMECVHEIDYLRWLGGEIAQCRARGGRVSGLEIDGEDWASVGFRFADGAVGEMTVDYLSPLKIRGCELIGTEAIVRWTSEGKAPERIRVERVDRAGAVTALHVSEGWDANTMYLDQLRHFTACVAGAASPLLDLDGGARVLEIALAAREAMDAEGEAWSDLAVGAAGEWGPR